MKRKHSRSRKLGIPPLAEMQISVVCSLPKMSMLLKAHHCAVLPPIREAVLGQSGCPLTAWARVNELRATRPDRMVQC